MSELRVALKQLDSGLPVPARGRAGDAAVDLPARQALVLQAGERAAVPTGFALAVPAGHAGLVLPRSGLALKYGITVVNGPGLIDSGYRGEITVILQNNGSDPVPIERGQRIAQLLVLPVPTMTFDLVSDLPPAVDDRGEQGFGSSG